MTDKQQCKKREDLKNIKIICIIMLVISIISLLIISFKLNTENTGTVKLDPKDPSNNITDGQKYNYDKDARWSIDEQPQASMFIVTYDDKKLKLNNDYSNFKINDDNIKLLFEDVISNYDKNINTKNLKINKVFYKDEKALSYVYKDEKAIFKISIKEDHYGFDDKGSDRKAYIDINVTEINNNKQIYKTVSYLILITMMIEIITVSYIKERLRLIEESKSLPLKYIIPSIMFNIIILSIIIISILTIINAMFGSVLGFIIFCIVIVGCLLLIGNAASETPYE